MEAQHDKVNQIKFLSKTKKIKSICLQSEPILEEIEEHLYEQMDSKNHTFKLPSKLRISKFKMRGNMTMSEHSYDMGDNPLETICEERKEDQDDKDQLQMRGCRSPKH